MDYFCILKKIFIISLVIVLFFIAYKLSIFYIPFIIAYLISISIVTVVLTIYDKIAAKRRAFRISEAT